VLGEVYEYFLGQFATAEGKKGGQFYTPGSVVRVLVAMLSPHKGRIYDPCCAQRFWLSESFELDTHGSAIYTKNINLALSPKSKTHVRSLMHGLVEFAMWSGLLDISRNPVSLVRNIGATRKVRKARSLTAEQFHALLQELQEPFGTMALLSVCLGLRFSEALALRWSDVDWLRSRLSIRRGIVNQIVGDVKTQGSAKTFNLASELLECLKSWKQSSQFSGAEDWVFASPFKLGRLPYSYTGTRQELGRASKAAGSSGRRAARWSECPGCGPAVRRNNPAQRPSGLDALVVEREPFDQQLAEPCRGPLAELGAAQ
jgi:integrase